MTREHENHLPQQDSNSSFEKQDYEAPIQKSGLELAENIADITSEAMLIVAQPLNHEPKSFSKYHFLKEREFLLQQTQETREVLLEQLSLRLSKEQREKNTDAVRNFLNDFKEYIPNKNKEHFKRLEDRDIKAERDKNFAKRKHGRFYSKEKDLDFKMMKDALSSLTRSEVYIQDVFEIYLDLTHVLNDLNLNVEMFEAIMMKKEKENKIKYTMH